MKNYRFLFVAVVSCCLGGVFSACDENDGDKPDNNEEISMPNALQVFTGGIPSKVGDAKITVNGDGQVTSIAGKWSAATFSYTPVSRIVDYDMTMTIKYFDEPGTDVFYIRLNDLNFIEYALQISDDGEEEWWFDYDKDSRLNYMKRTEGDNEVTRISYRDGDITGISMTSDNPENEYSATIVYTNASVASPIPNKGCVMLFDETFGIDMDEMAVAYYAGLLGKSTTHLPAGLKDRWYDMTFEWTLNAAGFPVAFEDKPYGDGSTTFAW
ncbi:MAG: DUF4595 domain-containing protein [Bacteroides sp.]|nr:DUF4595 domain-containing protein [Bacteroides sp.]